MVIQGGSPPVSALNSVVLELSLPDHSGFQTLEELVPIACRPQVAVIILTLMTH